MSNEDNLRFQEWIWGEFEEWRKGTTKGPTAFARYLEVKQQYVSGWLNGKSKPGTKFIPQLAEKLGPGVYKALDLPLPKSEDFRQRLDAALREALTVMIEKGVAPGSPEGDRIIAEIADRFGFDVRITSEE